MPESNDTLQDRMVAYSEKLVSRRNAIERSTRQGAEFVVGLVSGKDTEGLVAAISGAGESGLPEDQALEVVSLADRVAEQGHKSVMEEAGSDVFDRLEEVFANKLIKEMVDIHVRRPIA